MAEPLSSSDATAKNLVKHKLAKEKDEIDKAWTVLDAPDSFGGVFLTDLGKKNWVTLQNFSSKPKARNCSNCDNPLDWRTNGQLRIQGRYYQSNCYNGCHKAVVNNKVFTIHCEYLQSS